MKILDLSNRFPQRGNVVIGVGKRFSYSQLHKYKNLFFLARIIHHAKTLPKGSRCDELSRLE